MKFKMLAGLAMLVTSGTAAVGQDRPLTLGVLTDISGPYANYSGMGSVEATKLAVEDFGSEVLGRKIRVIFADHQNKPDLAASIARQWYDADGVEVILDVTFSSAALAVQEVSRQAKKIVLLSTAAAAVINGKSCSPYSAQWTFDSYSLAKGVAAALVKGGAKKWFFITADYAYGHSVQADLTKFAAEAGGSVVGSVLHPVGTKDFASYLLKAKSSGADVIVLGNAGEDLNNTIKQSSEFGIASGGQKLAVPLISVPQLHALGIDAIQGVVATNAFVWNRNDETTAWSRRFYQRLNAMPADSQAGNYSSALHYLKAVKAVGSTDADAVMAKMRATPVDDMFSKGGELRINGQMAHEMYLVQAKPKPQMAEPWDYVKILRAIPAAEAFRPLQESECPLVKR